jgi:hypothetical protein
MVHKIALGTTVLALTGTLVSTFNSQATASTAVLTFQKE